MNRKQVATNALGQIRDQYRLSFHDYLFVHEAIDNGSFWAMYNLLPGRDSQTEPKILQTIALFVAGARGIVFKFIKEEDDECMFITGYPEDADDVEYFTYKLIARSSARFWGMKHCIWLRDDHYGDIRKKQNHVVGLAVNIMKSVSS